MQDRQQQMSGLMAVEKIFFRPKEAAYFLGCSVATLGRMEKAGKLAPREYINARWCGWRRQPLVDCLERLLADAKKDGKEKNDDGEINVDKTSDSKKMATPLRSSGRKISYSAGGNYN